MDRALYDTYIEILKEELVPAMGCTEPISVAYCAAIARSTLGYTPETVQVAVSANIIKNVKSVKVPHTGGRRGIAVAAAAGIVFGQADKALEVISSGTEEDVERMADFLNAVPITVSRSDNDYIFDIQVRVSGNGHTAFAQIAGDHTNLIRLEHDGEVIKQVDFKEETATGPDHTLLNVAQIVEFADEVDIEDVRPILGRQIEYNMAIAEEGMHGNYGANIGKTLLHAYGTSVSNRAKAYAAAGSDARMNGCDMPVVINSGSGNQGITTSVPVIVYAREMMVSEAQLLRALTVANLITIHLKTGIGKLSAYCGATSAGCGAAAGVSYLYGGKFYEISHVVVNAVAIASGMICDGAKASCAAKIASAVEAGLLGLQMQKQGMQFYGGDGIVTKGVENTIRNVGRVAKIGMAETDREIIRLMTE